MDNRKDDNLKDVKTNGRKVQNSMMKRKDTIGIVKRTVTVRRIIVRTMRRRRKNNGE